MQRFDRFYQKTLEERQAIIADYLTEMETTQWELPPEIANQMIENYIGNYALPFGVAPTFCVNGVSRIIPMATEEPSVVAAASNGGKRLGNIQARVLEREVIGQIILMDLADWTQVSDIVAQKQAEWLEAAKQACPSMVARGGGPRRIWYEIFEAESLMSVYLTLNPCDAMGANVMNTVLEAIAPVVAADLQGDVLMSILSNHGERALVEASVTLAMDSLHANAETGRLIAQKIALASRVAQVDPHRAVTHNKGIMNGVDAVLIATGNDWRAVEAGVHAHAAKSGQYRGLSTWHYDEAQATLIGKIVLPLQVATVGGTLSVHPTAKLALALLQQPNARELAEIIAAVGLAQNFAALRALVTDGIQKGHMALQARSLALQVGATLAEVPLLVAKLRQQPAMNRTVAEQLLAELRN